MLDRKPRAQAIQRVIRPEQGVPPVHLARRNAELQSALMTVFAAPPTTRPADGILTRLHMDYGHFKNLALAYEGVPPGTVVRATPRRAVSVRCAVSVVLFQTPAHRL